MVDLTTFLCPACQFPMLVLVWESLFHTCPRCGARVIVLSRKGDPGDWDYDADAIEPEDGSDE
jgi:DNA-directed RNA polymerase subunit RPC12/RpoP